MIVKEHYLCVVVQVRRFDGGVCEQQPRHQKVIPGAQQLLLLQQSVFIAHQDLTETHTIRVMMIPNHHGSPEVTTPHLADGLQVTVASEGVVLETAVTLLVPVSPFHIKLGQCLSSCGLNTHTHKHDYFITFMVTQFYKRNEPLRWLLQ